MKHCHFFFGTVLALAVVVPALALAQPLVFSPVTVIDLREGLARPDRTVIVTDDRITAVGPVDEIEVPDDARIIDGTGKYLIPGLWDMHAHTMSIPIARDIYFPLFIANGVTGIRTMKTDCFESEQPDCFEEGLADPIPSIYDVKRWRKEIQAGTLIGPRIVAGSAMLDGPGPDEPSTPFNPGTAEHARQHARILQERGVDFAKIYNFIPREAYFAFADEANRLGLPFAGHVPEGVRASEASEAGQRSIEHAGFTNVAEECSSREDELRRRLRRRLRAELESDNPQIIPIWLDMVESYDAAKCAKVFETLVRNETWVTPTLVSGERLPGEIEFDWRDDPRMRYLPREEREWWSNSAADFGAMGANTEQQQTLAKFERDVTLAQHRAGVPLLAGSDIPAEGVFAGFGLHDELEVLVAIGLTEAEALRTATLEPARYLEAVDTQGTVEVGKIADLVLLDANPLEDIRNTQKIRAVVANGRYLDRDALDALLEKAETAARATEDPVPQTTPAQIQDAATPSHLEPIIDVHLHAMRLEDADPPGERFCMAYSAQIPPIDPGKESVNAALRAWKRDPGCPGVMVPPETDEALMQQTLEVLRRRNIKAVVSGTPDMVSRWKAEAPDHVIAARSFDLGQHAGVTPADLEKSHREGEFEVLGEVTNQYFGYAPNAKGFDAYWAMAARNDIPVGIHIGYMPPGAGHWGIGARMSIADPLLLEEVIVRYPTLRVYIMHAGYPQIERTIALMLQYPQVYADTGMLQALLTREAYDAFLARMFDAGLGKRLMYGTDQIIWPEMIERSLEMVENTDQLTDTEKRDLLYNNAARFFRIDEMQGEATR